jgi:hypothetical protein
VGSDGRNARGLPVRNRTPVVCSKTRALSRVKLDAWSSRLLRATCREPRLRPGLKHTPDTPVVRQSLPSREPAFARACLRERMGAGEGAARAQRSGRRNHDDGYPTQWYPRESAPPDSPCSRAPSAKRRTSARTSALVHAEQLPEDLGLWREPGPVHIARSPGVLGRSGGPKDRGPDGLERRHRRIAVSQRVAARSMSPRSPEVRAKSWRRSAPVRTTLPAAKFNA